MIKNNFKIAVINNTNINRCLISNELKSKNYNIEELNSESSSIDFINKNDIDLVIINSDKSNNKIEKFISSINTKNIIFLTNDGSEESKEKFKNYNLLEYNIKFNNLVQIIDNIIILIDKLIRNKSLNILLICKKNTNQDIKDFLKDRCFNLDVVNSGVSGWKYLDKNDKLSMILIDLSIDDIDIVDIITKARKNICDNLPIIAINDSFDSVMMQSCIQNGLSDFIKTPILKEEFNLKIDLWINHLLQSRQLRTQKNSIDALVNSTIEALFMFDDNICVNVNDEAIRMFEYSSKDELIGINISNILSSHISTHDKEGLLKNDVDYEFEILMVKKSKEEFPVQIKERNILLDNKEVKIIAIIDLTQIKKNEKMLVQQSKLASMGEMIGNIAHQWRQPLSSISIAASGIKVNYELDMVDETELFEELDSIVSSTIFLSDTIDDFQSFIKGDSIPSNYILEDMINKVLKLVIGNIKSSNIKVIKNFDNDIKMFGLANELVQAILNIVNNARDALKDKDIKPRLILIDTSYDKNKNNIKIDIQDNASGVPKDIIGKIFDPYFTTKHKSQGTGLGLYMTHQMIVDHMKGKLEVNNTTFTYKDISYKGALFTITLPVK